MNQQETRGGDGFIAMTERSDAWRKVRAILYMRGWTQADLGTMTGYSAIYVRDVLQGLRKSEKVQEKIARVIGLSCWAELEEADVGVRNNMHKGETETKNSDQAPGKAERLREALRIITRCNSITYARAVATEALEGREVPAC